ncbi:MAG: metallophosphoesterase [Nitrososphaerales archaeon]
MRFAGMILTMVSASAGYLYVLNRLLIQMRGKRLKSFMIRAGGLLTLAGSGLLGWRIGRSRWVLLPLAGVILTLAGEARRLMIRNRHRGSGPVAEHGPAMELARPATTTDLVMRHYEVPVEGWSGPALRVAHVSDFHLNSHLPMSYFQEAMRRVASVQPDLVVFTGDFVTYAKYIPLMAEVLPLATGRLGSYGVIGNHDHWASAAAVRATARSAGVEMLDGRPVRLPLESGHTVVLTGFEHPWGSAACEAPERNGHELQIVLTHTPDNIYELQGQGFDAVFAGHYHGGQIRVPGLGPLVVPSKYGRRYDRGLFVFGRTHLFVTWGVGSAAPPLRIWCPPDVLVVDFLPSGAAA